MPSIASAPPSPILNSKKRRRDDHSSTASAYADASAMSFEMQLEIAIAASPRLSRHDPVAADKLYEDFSSQRAQLLPRSRTKRQRPSGPFDAWKAIEVKENGVGYLDKDRDNGLDVKEERAVKEVKVDLRSCHICHRKPSARRELDEYGDCEGCGRRTCYICIRQCDGLSIQCDGRRLCGGGEAVYSGIGEYDDLVREGRGRDGEDWEVERGVGHKSKVCSRCCVERGADGEVWCLGCLRAEG